MKKILITGKDSYIGTSFEKYMSQWPEEYNVDTLDMKDSKWSEKDFSGFDVVFHVAGIAHVKETSKNKELYYKINRDLAIETAEKAKKSGVKQFVFLSSMSVYGMETGVINKDTKPFPKTNYGKSKLMAEVTINKMKDINFSVAIVRPPMVYGKGCKGNYARLSKLALKAPIFPDIKNRRSMIYIDNLSETIKQIIDNKDSGNFYPQNIEYVCTSEMVKLIADSNGKKIIMTKFFNTIIRICKVGVVKKIFGDLVYEIDNSKIKGLTFEETIIKSEGM